MAIVVTLIRTVSGLIVWTRPCAFQRMEGRPRVQRILVTMDLSRLT